MRSTNRATIPATIRTAAEALMIATGEMDDDFFVADAPVALATARKVPMNEVVQVTVAGVKIAVLAVQMGRHRPEVYPSMPMGI